MSVGIIRDVTEWAKVFWCRCGNGNPDVVLRDYLAVFEPVDEDERDEVERQYAIDYRRQYLDLEASKVFIQEHGNDVFHLIGYLLDGSGIIEHSGSVSSSAWLTPLGIELKTAIESGEFPGDDE